MADAGLAIPRCRNAGRSVEPGRRSSAPHGSECGGLQRLPGALPPAKLPLSKEEYRTMQRIPRIPVVLAAALLACLTATACSRPETDANAPAAADKGDDGAGPAGATDATGRPTTSTSPKIATAAGIEYEFPLLTRKAEPVSDPRIVSTDQEHPCGPLDTVRVSAIPMDDPVFMPAYVVELDAQGKELGKWGIPVEAEVIGLDGRRLQFQAGTDRFWVDPQGALEKVAGSTPGEDLRTSEGMFDCPALPTFAESDAAQCFRVKDAAGAERRIAMEGTCS